MSTARAALNKEGRPVGMPPQGTRASGLLRFLVRHGGDLRFLEPEDIEWVHAEGPHVIIHAGADRAPLRRSLNDLETQLDRDRFLRISRSVIVNLRRVKQLIPWFAGEYVVQLVSGTRLKLTRTYADELFSRLGRPL